MDMALAGKTAIVEAIEQDFDDQVQLAVVLDDDPGRDLGLLRQPGHRFFFRPEEVEPA
jgi:Ni2+-binding GTPase involved in maturation of urease and hydrogenase